VEEAARIDMLVALTKIERLATLSELSGTKEAEELLRKSREFREVISDPAIEDWELQRWARALQGLLDNITSKRDFSTRDVLSVAEQLGKIASDIGIDHKRPPTSLLR
jgi:hypothetical protein